VSSFLSPVWPDLPDVIPVDPETGEYDDRLPAKYQKAFRKALKNWEFVWSWDTTGATHRVATVTVEAGSVQLGTECWDNAALSWMPAEHCTPTTLRTDACAWRRKSTLFLTAKQDRIIEEIRRIGDFVPLDGHDLRTLALLVDKGVLAANAKIAKPVTVAALTAQATAYLRAKKE